MSALTIFTNHLFQNLWQDGTPYSRILTALSFGALTLMGSIAAHSFARAKAPARSPCSVCQWGFLYFLHRHRGFLRV